MSKHRGLAKLAAVLGAMAMSLTGMIAITNTANAVSATDGNGRMSPSINWVEWDPTAGTPVTGDKVAWTTPVPAGDDTWLSTRCEIKPVVDPDVDDSLSASNSLTVYKPGSWYGDGLAQMYYVGGSGYGNDMKIGLANTDDGEKVTFDFSCAAYAIDSPSGEPVLNDTTDVSGTAYTNIDLQGLVFADAESNNWTYYQQEYIKATPESSIAGKDPAWRVLDSHRTDGCTTNSVAEMKGDTVRFRSDAGQCGNSGGNGPSSVMFLQNSESARVTLKGGGKTAVALGSIAATDFGDAPIGSTNPYGNYGVAGSLLQPQWKGGKLGEDVTGTTYSRDSVDPDDSMDGGTLFNLSKAKDDFSATNPSLAQFDEPAPRLGATEDSEVRSHPTNADANDFEKNADWDDKNGDSNTTVGAKEINDEDGVAIPTDTGAVQVVPDIDDNNTFTLKVRCAGTGNVRGWIDWNNDGKFNPAEAQAPEDVNAEASNQTQCVTDPDDTVTGHSATLKWIAPGDSKRQVGSESGSSYMRLRITNQNIADMQPTGLTMGSGEVEDYKADVHTPTLTLLTNIAGNRKAGDADQFTMQYKYNGDVDGGPITTTGDNGGVQAEGIRSKSVGPGFEYDLFSDLTSTAGTDEDDYATKLDCVDLSTGKTVPITGVDENHIQMPNNFDANVQCTYTKTAKGSPSLTLVTEVHNNHGGTAEAKDFEFEAVGASHTYQYKSDNGSDSHSVDEHDEYTITGTYPGTTDGLPDGYVQDGPIKYIDNDTGDEVQLTDGKLVLEDGQHVTGTRVVRDSPGKLTLKTVVNNDFGGTAVSTDFNFTVIPNGKTVLDGVSFTENVQQELNAGSYTVIGSDKPGYEQVGDITYTDAGGNPLTPVAAQIAIASGQSVTGVRTVRSKPANLTIITHVDGGHATADNFPVTVTPGSNSPVDMTDSVSAEFAAGPDNKIETDMSQMPGYEVVHGKELSCVVNNSAPVDVNNASIALLNGQNVVCQQTVKPKAATLTLKTEVERGDAQPSDFNFTVTPNTGSPVTYEEGVATTPPVGGIASIEGSSKSNYEESAAIVYYKDTDTNHTTPLSLADAQTALDNGESVTGIRKVTTHQPKLTVKLHRDYKYSDTASGDGSKITLDEQGGSSHDVTLDHPQYVAAGPYSVKQLLNDGYKQTDIKVALADGTPVTVNPDGTFEAPADADIVVTLTNQDKPGTLEWSRFDEDGTTLLSGSQWRLNGPDGTVLNIDDCTAEVCTGLDKDPTPGKFKVTGLKWGNWTITETKAPAGHKLTKPQTLTLDPAKGPDGLRGVTSFKDGLPGLSSTGSDVTWVVMIAVATLGMGMLLAGVTRKMMDCSEQ